jgi:hypothetical protein
MIDVRKIKTLGRLLFKLETRSRSGSKRKMAFLMITYLLPGCFLPLLLIKQNTDPTGFEFTFLTYLFYSLVIAFTISGELDNLLITRTEAEIFNAMPLDDRLLVRAKLFMLNRYIMMLAIPLFVPGATYYYFIMKSVPRSVMYFVAGYMSCYFTVSILLFLYAAAIKIFKAGKLNVYTLIFQLFLVLLMIIGYQLISFGITGKQSANAVNYLHLIQKNSLIDFFPAAWYAFLPSRSQYEPSFALLFKLILPFFIFYFSYLSLRMYLEENLGVIKEKISYAGFRQEIIGEGSTGNPLFAAIGNLVNSFYLRNSTERSAFSLMSSMFRQDKAMKLNVIPMIIIPSGLAIFALLTNQLPPPFEGMFFELKPVFHISILLSVLVVLNTSILGMKVTNNRGASWIYDSYPMDSKKRFKNGIRKFFIIYLLVPLFVILAIIFSFAMPLWQALLHTLFIFAAANLYNSMYNLVSRVLPFSRENTLLNSVQKLSGMVFPFIYGTIIVMVQMLAYRNLPSSIIVLLVIITLNFWLNFFGFVHLKAARA